MVATAQSTYNSMVSLWSARRISILLTIVALVLWSYSITQTKLNIDFYGLIHSFPVTFFLALGILTIASAILWVSKDNHEKLLFFQVSLLIVSLWLVPLLIGGSQPVAFHVQQKFTENVSPIIQRGYLSGGIWYHSWPAMWIEGAALLDVLGLHSSEVMIFLTPCLVQFLFLLPLYVFLRNTFGKGRNNYYWAGIWLFELANWLEQNYFGPQAMALLLILMLLAILSRPLASNDRVGTVNYTTGGDSIGIVLIFACLTVTHVLSSLVALIMIALVYIVNRKSMRLNLFILPAVFIVAWMVYQTTAFFESNIQTYMERAFRLDLTLWSDIFGGTSGSRGIAGSESHQVVSTIRIVTSAIFASITLIGMILSRWFKEKTLSDNTVMAIGTGVLLGLISGLYGMEMLQRSWFFFLPVVAYFGMKLLNHKVTTFAFCLLLLVSLPFHFISHYGNEAIDYFSRGYEAGLNYVSEVKQSSDYPFAIVNQINWEEGQLVFAKSFPQGKHYLAISRFYDSYYTFLYNRPDYVDSIWDWLYNSNSYDYIYANPEFDLYINQAR
ncbi:MAG: hypothetical protein PHQ86_08410 [Dehalococcoidales bacterium]|nr:hypothetical protein [Dehalococcoidales bacterium]